MSVREKPVEVITRGERRRSWTGAQKRDIVMESLEPGGSPIAVARRHGIGTGLLYTWRRQIVSVAAAAHCGAEWCCDASAGWAGRYRRGSQRLRTLIRLLV
ncbi:transposase [Muricoccus nepalensis]